jgi:NADH dehydrogenase
MKKLRHAERYETVIEIIILSVEGRGAKLLYASLYRMHQAVLYGWTRATLLWIGGHLRSVALPQLKLH